jgi:glycosyltransferase involved in cell wall biosynthesis
MARTVSGRPVDDGAGPSGSRPTIICFAGDSWDGNPHSRHHLMRRFAARFEVLFVEGVPMRSVAPGRRGELRRVATKLRGRGGLRTVAPHLHVLAPLPLPPTGALGRRLQVLGLRAQVLAARRRLGLGGPAISWFSQPVCAPLRGRVGDCGSIFYYQDRYDAFSHVNVEHLRRCIAELAVGCDIAIASAEELAGDLRALGAQPSVVPHGVDTERFAGRPPEPAELVGLERPLIGYVGILDDYLDLSLFTAVADRLGRGTVVVVGPQNTDVSALRGHSRVRLLGPRPYDAIPGYLGAFACCLVPFAINRLTVAVNPIKLREYLAAGRPVVCTPMPEILEYGDVVTIADGAAAFAAAVVAAVAEADDEGAIRRRRERVAGESWDAAAARIEPHLTALLRLA